MMQIYLHREAGLRLQKSDSSETLYLDSLFQAVEDAEISLGWPEPNVLRIFPLEDGRIVAVRETPYGLSQEAASPAIQAFHEALNEQAELLIQKAAEREANDKAVSDEL
jgi:hypothetical protein